MCWGVRTHTLRLQGKGTPRPWGSVGENMGEALPALPWGLPLSGVFPRYFLMFPILFEQGGRIPALGGLLVQKEHLSSAEENPSFVLESTQGHVQPEPQPWAGF